MTLIEVVVVTGLITVVLGGAIIGVTQGNRLNYANGQRMAAFGLCKEWYEQMRSVGYTNVTETTFSPSTIKVTHVGGRYRMPLYGVRSCTIRTLANPERKEVDIRLRWTYHDRELEEGVQGVIYLKR
ncbi:MAG: hypothetical protein A2X46_09725 [Lentisphaerae bacterium GWF2_57_35]|nr:MAG: hypothetical protein A2X46_09725 [Lentisphaerae bacterium GWF2_57_35]